VALAHNDGDGNFTQVDFVVVNGVPQSTDWRPGFGTYTVNPDCTVGRRTNLRDDSLRPTMSDAG
jgi:hypothetical protein